jgi:hypothetical protein
MRATQVHELDDDQGRDSCHSSVRYLMEIENSVKFEVAAMTGTCRTGGEKGIKWGRKTDILSSQPDCNLI